MPSDQVARNFIYLDFERVRSLLSQIDIGLLDTIQTTRGREQGTDVAGENQIPLDLRGSTRASLMFKHEAVETKSLHHYLYSEFEQTVVRQHVLRDLNSEFQDHSWSDRIAQTSLQPGNLFKVTAPLSIFDYEYMTETLRSLIILSEQMPKLQSQGAKSPQSPSLTETKKLADMKKQIEAFSKIIESLYAKTISVRIYPDTRSAIPYLLGHLEPVNLQYNRENLLFLYGQERQRMWTVVGMIASKPQLATSSQALPSQASSQNQIDMEAILEQFLSVFLASGMKYKVSDPAVGVVPLAIYAPIIAFE